MNSEYISIFKRRIYRFCDDLLLHIFAEQLEEESFKGNIIKSEELNLIIKFLENHKANVIYLKEYINTKQKELKDELEKRLDFENKFSNKVKPKKVIHIIGSPRSGTSHLFNMLSYQKSFSYFSSISHYLWPTYNYHIRYQELLEESDENILLKDTKSLRIIPNLILPSESEDIFNRAIKIYDHIKNHEYNMHSPIKVNIGLLKEAIEKHLFFQEREYFLSKSPFNSFRVKELSQLYENTFFIHIFRNGYNTTKSISDNKFKYYHSSMLNKDPSSVDFWRLHIMSILNDAPKHRTLHISYEALMQNPRKYINLIMEKFEIPYKNIRLPKSEPKHQLNNFHEENMEIEEINYLLNNLVR